MKPEVFTLTADQALDELAAIMDARPGDEDTLGVINWQKANSDRAKALEAWILMKAPKPLPERQPVEDAPQHLKALPEPAKEKPVSTKKTPKEKLQSLVDSYHVLVDKLQDDHTNRRFRDDASSCKSRMGILEREFHLTRPELLPIPAIKQGRPANPPTPSVDQVLDQHVPVAPAEIHIHTSKAGPGPYVPPTAADLREMLPKTSTRVIDPPTDAPADALQVRENLRLIRRNFMHVLVDLEGLGFIERRALGEDLRSLDNLVATAVILVEEPSGQKAG